MGGMGIIFEDEKILALMLIGTILSLAGFAHEYYHGDLQGYTIGKIISTIVRRVIFGSIIMTTIFFTISYYYPAYPIIATAGISGFFSYYAEDIGSSIMFLIRQRYLKRGDS